MRKSHVAALAVAATLGAGAAPALAHTELVSSTPRAGAVVQHLPRTLTLTFDDPILRVASIRVTLAGANRVVGTPARAPRNARRALARVRGDAQGLYTVAWSVVGADGHTITGSHRFRVRR